MTSNEAIEQGFIPYPYTFPAIKFEVSNEEENIPEVEFIQIIHIPEVTLDEYAAQLEVTNEEALAILDAEAVADDAHLDTVLELE